MDEEVEQTHLEVLDRSQISNPFQRDLLNQAKSTYSWITYFKKNKCLAQKVTREKALNQNLTRKNLRISVIKKELISPGVARTPYILHLTILN